METIQTGLPQRCKTTSGIIIFMTLIQDESPPPPSSLGITGIVPNRGSNSPTGYRFDVSINDRVIYDPLGLR